MSIPKPLQLKILLILVCAIFLFTRLYKISDIPASLYWDEASIGYNAYAISETGRDEWGEILPIHFRAFGEFKLPVYIYSVMPFVKFFGLNEFSVRFPAVLFSLGIVILTYLLVRKLLNSKTIGVLSSLFVSISPWFFIFSRTGYEATAGLFFNLLAILFFLKYKKSRWYILFSIVSFILSAYSYNSFRIIAPLTILILIIYELKQLVIFKKFILPLILSGAILVLSIIPIYRLYKYDAGNARLQAISATNSSLTENYLVHFSPDFLFLQGDKNLRSQQFGFGQLYLPELILLPLGALYVLKNRSRINVLPLLLLFLGILPAAITKESPHALRAISSMPFFAIISAMGVVYLKNIVRLKYLVELIIVIIFMAFFVNYFATFLRDFPVQSSKDWQYGYKTIFTNFQDVFPKYDRIIISDEYAQPYIFALFYQKINPEKFNQSVIRNSVDNWGFSTVSSFDKFEFGKINKLFENAKSGSSLIFASNQEDIAGFVPAGKINFLDGTTAFWIYKYQNDMLK